MTTETVDPRYALARSALNDLAQRAYEKPGDVTHALKRLAEFFPVVAPGGTTNCAVVAEGYKALITYVVAERPQTTPDGKEIPGTGDVFMDRQTKQWCFKHAFLKKLAAGIGLEWLAERRLDSFAHPFVCAIEVKGRYRDYSGEWRQILGSHQLDLRDEAAHGKTPAQLLKARQSIHQLCASMAKSRAIADACVSRTIADSDLGAPIVCAKLYRADPIDPAEARRGLYGDDHTPVDDVDQPRAVAHEVVNEHTGEITQGKPVPQTSSAPNAPSAGAPSNGGPGSGRRSASPASVGRLVPAGFPGAGKSIEALDLETLKDLRAKVQAFIEAKRAEKVPEEKLAAVTAFLGDVELRMDALRPPAGPAPSDPEMDEWQRDYDAAGNK